MTVRLKRAMALVIGAGCAYAIDRFTNAAPSVFIALGDMYECSGESVYNGSQCVNRNPTAYTSPPCTIGWKEIDGVCVWRQ